MLTPDQLTPAILAKVGTVLKYAAGFDQRKIGDADVKSWALAVGEWPEADLVQAVVAYYCETGTTERHGRPWIMPADVLKRVKAARHDRIEHNPVLGIDAPSPDHTGEVDADDYQRMMAARRRNIADGRVLGGISERLGNARLRALPAPGAEPAPRGRAILPAREGSPEERQDGWVPPVPPDRPAYDDDTRRRLDDARATLNALPDYGQAYMAAAYQKLGRHTAVVTATIHAAELAAQAKEAS